MQSDSFWHECGLMEHDLLLHMLITENTENSVAISSLVLFAGYSGALGAYIIEEADTNFRKFFGFFPENHSGRLRKKCYFFTTLRLFRVRDP